MEAVSTQTEDVASNIYSGEAESEAGEGTDVEEVECGKGGHG